MHEESLENKVLSWLQTTGFPLEMAAADAFRRAGFDVRQSTTYVDPETKKGREVDVLALADDWIGAVDIGFVLECKSSNKPWVVLCSETALANYNRLLAFAVTSAEARKVLSKKTNELKSWPSIERSNDTGYGFRQVLGDRSDAAYGAAMNVLKACADLAKASDLKSYKPASFYFPVVVVDTPLFECRLQENGELTLKRVQRSEFLFTAHVPEPVGCCVRVVAKDALAAWATEAKSLADTLREDFKPFEERFLGRLGGKEIDEDEAEPWDVAN